MKNPRMQPCIICRVNKPVSEMRTLSIFELIFRVIFTDKVHIGIVRLCKNEECQREFTWRSTSL